MSTRTVELPLQDAHFLIQDVEAGSVTKETLIDMTDALSEAEKTHFAYGNEFCRAYLEKCKMKEDEQSLRSERTGSRGRLDHVYEEVNAIKDSALIEYDILDYYEKYSPTTAKTLINTLFLPRHKICKQCARLQSSPVYTDSLIYAKRPIVARQAELFHEPEVLSFQYSIPLFLQYWRNEPCMLVHSCSKTNASSIFYYDGPPRDVFDLKMSLKPSILLASSYPGETSNTQLYHRSVNSAYRRVSTSGSRPMTFKLDHEDILTGMKHVGYDTDLQNWMSYRNDVYQSRGLKQAEIEREHRANRSSLLLLEPLLLMPDLARPRCSNAKNRVSHSEHMKIIKIVIAYTLSFLILASITFYIVYFT